MVRLQGPWQQAPLPAPRLALLVAAGRGVAGESPCPGLLGGAQPAASLACQAAASRWGQQQACLGGACPQTQLAAWLGLHLPEEPWQGPAARGVSWGLLGAEEALPPCWGLVRLPHWTFLQRLADQLATPAHGQQLGAQAATWAPRRAAAVAAVQRAGRVQSRPERHPA